MSIEKRPDGGGKPVAVDLAELPPERFLDAARHLPQHRRPARPEELEPRIQKIGERQPGLQAQQLGPDHRDDTGSPFRHASTIPFFRATLRPGPTCGQRQCRE